MMSTEEFITRLDGTVSWDSHFLPQIIKTVQSVFERLDDFEPAKNCFELYGFDFVIDEQLKCWLLEANMSPACAYREGQEWLGEMLDDMSDGMVNLIEEKVAATFLNNLTGKTRSVDERMVGGLLAERCRQVGMPVDIKGWVPISLEMILPKV